MANSLTCVQHYSNLLTQLFICEFVCTVNFRTVKEKGDPSGRGSANMGFEKGLISVCFKLLGLRYAIVTCKTMISVKRQILHFYSAF